MKIFGREIILRRVVEEAKQAPFEGALMRIAASMDGYMGWGSGLFGYGSGAIVTPENCMSSPTVQAIVTAVARRISVSPVQVFKRRNMKFDTDEGALSDTRARKELQPNHPIAKLLAAPNDWQTRVNYWQDATSRILRYGNAYAYKSRGSTGPIRELISIPPRQVAITQDLETWAVTYRINGVDYSLAKLHHARGPARNGFMGDSPIMDVASSVALEIAAEQFGWSFFNNGALPLLIFQFVQGNSGFKTDEERKKFVDDFQAALSGQNRHRGMLLPKGIEVRDPVAIENDKAQFLETRKYQRTVIAGAFGVPPHLVGDLERATFNNVEQQGADFTVNVVLPIAQQFESAMERDLLTDADRAGGIIIRFDLDSVQLTDFKSRQEGLLIQRNAGVICPNDWRERESMNPIPEDDGGEAYIRPLNFVVAGSPQEDNLNAPPVTNAPGTLPKPAAAADTMKQLIDSLRELKQIPDPGDMVELMEKVAGRAQPSIIVNIPELPAPIVYVDAPTVNVAVEPTPIEVTVDAPRVKAPDVHVHVPEQKPTETIPVRDSKTGRVIQLVQRPIKFDKG